MQVFFQKFLNLFSHKKHDLNQALRLVTKYKTFKDFNDYFLRNVFIDFLFKISSNATILASDGAFIFSNS